MSWILGGDSNKTQPNQHISAAHSDFRLTTPVAFFIFRRPETTKQVLEAIARAKPSLLFVIADGPRTIEETKICAETRALIESIDWNCEVIKNYADTNLGLKKRFTSGLNWLFEQVEEAIILEDDCLPDDTFFRFCQELLEKYRDESRIMHISGDYFLETSNLESSYYFTRYAHIWGWATWKRAWAFYNGDLQDWKRPDERKRFLNKFPNESERHFWASTVNIVAEGGINTWDFQWLYTCIKYDKLAINPVVNLISNIGFGADATNTEDAQNFVANLPVLPMVFPLKHPTQIARDIYTDKRTAHVFFRSAPYWKRLLVNFRNRLLSL